MCASSPCAVFGSRRSPWPKADDFDEWFDRGEDLGDALDPSPARRPGVEARRVYVDYPAWVVEALDREARRPSVTGQSVINVSVAERLRKTGS